MKNRIGFSYFHPVILLVFFVVQLLVTMFSKNPALLASSLVGGIAFFECISHDGNKKGRLYIIVLAVVITVTNPLFSHNGVTVMFYLGDIAYTLESLLYGVDIAIMITAVIIWCRCIEICFGQDKAEYIFAKTIPKTSIIITMALRFIPQYRKQLEQIKQTQQGLGLYAKADFRSRLKTASAVFLSLVTWSFENAVDTGISMTARGYGEKGRTTYNRYCFKKHDAFVLLIIAALSATTLTLLFFVPEFVFYPTLSTLQLSTPSLVCYASFAVLSFFPVIYELLEKIRWNYYKSKI